MLTEDGGPFVRRKLRRNEELMGHEGVRNLQSAILKTLCRLVNPDGRIAVGIAVLEPWGMDEFVHR